MQKSFYYLAIRNEVTENGGVENLYYPFPMNPVKIRKVRDKCYPYSQSSFKYIILNPLLGRIPEDAIAKKLKEHPLNPSPMPNGKPIPPPPLPPKPNYLKSDYELQPTPISLYTKNGSNWQYMGCKTNPMVSEGWKFHLSCNAKDCETLMNLALPILQSLTVNHKLVRIPYELWVTRGTQAGKFITIYPTSINEAWGVIDGLNPISQKFTGPAIEGEKLLPSTSILYMRYGSHEYDYILSPDDFGAKKSFVKDIRGDQYKPEWIPDFPTSRPTSPNALNRFPKYTWSQVYRGGKRTDNVEQAKRNARLMKRGAGKFNPINPK